MDVAVGVVAHVQRAFRHQQLQQDSGADVFNIDDGTLKCEENHLVVMRKLLGRGAQWSVILEDDAQPCRGFRSEIGKALKHAPAPIVGLYLGTGNPTGETQRQIRQAVTTAQQRGHHWIMADCLIGGVGYAIRSDVLPEVLVGIADRDEELPLRISRWAQDHNVNICYTRPSLINHEDSDPIGHPWRGPNYLARRAWDFTGSTGTWNTSATTLGYCPNWSAEPEETDYLSPSKIRG